MDTVKANVAAAVRNRFLIGDAFVDDIAHRLDGTPENIMVSMVGDLQTHVRIWTPTGPRYFIIQLRESL